MKPPIFAGSGHNQDEPTSVYVLACGGRVKIGIAAIVRARVDHLQLSCPLPIDIAAERQFPTRTAARLVERSLHARYAHKRLHGEWFDMDAAEAVAAVRDAEEIAAPVKISGRFRKPEPVRHVLRRAAAPPRPVPVPTRDGPTEAEYDAMDAATWSEFMQPCAAVLDFMDPNARENADRLEAALRQKYPQYFNRAPA